MADDALMSRAADEAWYQVERSFGTIGSMENDELASYLNALGLDECCQVQAVLKTSKYEITELVVIRAENGSSLGPFIRKRIHMAAHMGAAYQELFAAQRRGRRFRHLPAVYSVHERDDELVVLMEYARGRTLHDEVYERDPSLALACELFPPLCDGVIELHEDFGAPLIHRDLKPTNVIVNGSSLTVIDFGIARAFREDASSDTAPFATRAYAPPEQFGYGQTDVRSDVYALGMVLYFLLTECNPTADVARSGFNDPRVPVALRPVLARATAFDPQGRYQSVRALKGAFTEAVAMLVGQGAASVRSPQPSAVAGGAVGVPAYPATPHPSLGTVPGPQNSGVPRAGWAPAAGVPAGGAPRTGAPNAWAGPAPVAGAPAASGAPTTGWPAARTPQGGTSLKVSEIIGVVWDGVVVPTWFLLVAVCIWVAFNPTPELLKYPDAVRVLAYLGLAVSFSGMAYALLDKRLLRRFIPLLKGQTFGKGLLIGGAVALGGFLFMAVLVLAASSAGLVAA
ncbi:protein kinase [Adlercreutzia equolifaciens]|uniref:serine/threonine protein kinase n=1 Tax=Adlercreutzia equolifaciens TaxID=446660 RepID=UPI0023AED045|nr:protein kinase [Adlercreutzia equolifaciens]MDE8702622.1 protein kinase [Adlercreutzia equolifaciens]